MSHLQQTYMLLMALSPFMGLIISYLIGWLEEPKVVLVPEVVSNGYVVIDMSERGKRFVEVVRMGMWERVGVVVL